ncbi:SunI/YnzG family protein [Bacillus cereus group sp. MYBK234-1]|uniref:SunI/YnzG family protein n=1 Tax=unclassified Bacillus cereus group TaxID=2750818 RepID=UPI003F7AE754
MKEIEIIKSIEKITITWQSAIISIPLEGIIEVSKKNEIQNTAKVVKIGNKFKSSETVFIRTKKLDYMLFTTNKLTLLNKLSFN